MCAQKEKWKGKKITGLSSFSIIHHHSFNLVQVIFLYTNKFTKYQAFDAYYDHWGQGHVKKGSNKQCRQLLMRYVKLWLLLLPANRVDLSKCITFNHTDKVIDPLTREWQMSLWPIVVHLISSHLIFKYPTLFHWQAWLNVLFKFAIWTKMRLNSAIYHGS